MAKIVFITLVLIMLRCLNFFCFFFAQRYFPLLKFIYILPIRVVKSKNEFATQHGDRSRYRFFVKKLYMFVGTQNSKILLRHIVCYHFRIFVLPCRGQFAARSRHIT